jgi:hypothetical protein
MMTSMMKGLVFMPIRNFLFAYVSSHNIASWHLIPNMKEIRKLKSAMKAAIFTWLVFFLPIEEGNLFWHKRSIKLFAINMVLSYSPFYLLAMIIAFAI